MRSEIYEVVGPLHSGSCRCPYKMICLASFSSNIDMYIALQLPSPLRQWMDISHRPSDDFCGTTGFILALRDCLRLQRGGLLWAGHPCNPLLAL